MDKSQNRFVDCMFLKYTYLSVFFLGFMRIKFDAATNPKQTL